MLSHSITGSRAWRADTIDESAAWRYSLPAVFLAAVDEIMGQRPRRPEDITEVPEPMRSAGVGAMAPLRAALEDGRGFGIVGGIPPERYSGPELTVAYWLLGRFLGVPRAQNLQGALLYDVRDTGQDVRYGARFSVTNAESTFHTDNSFGAETVDIIGLLCVNPAKAGGLTQLVSAYSVHNELLAGSRENLATLQQPLHIERRAGYRPGEPPTARFPIFAWDGRQLTCRYLRYWVEVGHKVAEEPLTPAQ